jgi:hypothetical protein
VKDEFRKYLLGMPELDAWKRNQILNYAEKLHKKEVNRAVFKTAIIINAVIIVMTFLWRVILG